MKPKAEVDMTTVGITGHQKIPAALVPQVLAGFGRVLASATGDIVGLTSLAAGADQLFARSVLDGGGRLHAIIPCERYESAFADEIAIGSFRELLAASSKVETLPYDRPSSQAFFDAGKRVVDLADLMIVVWDGELAQGIGGTADVVHYARDRGREVTNVWPQGASR